MVIRTAVTLIAMFLIVFGLGFRAGQRATKTITEDDPRWNCRTMGNHVCGPVVVEHAGHFDVLRGDGSTWLSEFETRAEAEGYLRDDEQ